MALPLQEIKYAIINRMAIEYILFSLSVLLFVLPIISFIHWRVEKVWRGVWISLLVIFLLWIGIMLRLLGAYVLYAVYFLPIIIVALIVIMPISWWVGNWMIKLKSRSDITRKQTIIYFVLLFMVAWLLSWVLFFVTSEHQQKRIAANWQKLPVCSKTITHDCRSE